MSGHLAEYENRPVKTKETLDAIQRDAFGYFVCETNPMNGSGRDGRRVTFRLSAA